MFHLGLTDNKSEFSAKAMINVLFLVHSVFVFIDYLWYTRPPTFLLSACVPGLPAGRDREPGGSGRQDHPDGERLRKPVRPLRPGPDHAGGGRPRTTGDHHLPAGERRNDLATLAAKKKGDTLYKDWIKNQSANEIGNNEKKKNPHLVQARTAATTMKPIPRPRLRS